MRGAGPGGDRSGLVGSTGGRVPGPGCPGNPCLTRIVCLAQQPGNCGLWNNVTSHLALALTRFTPSDLCLTRPPAVSPHTTTPRLPCRRTKAVHSSCGAWRRKHDLAQRGGGCGVYVRFGIRLFRPAPAPCPSKSLVTQVVKDTPSEHARPHPHHAARVFVGGKAGAEGAGEGGGGAWSGWDMGVLIGGIVWSGNWSGLTACLRCTIRASTAPISALSCTILAAFSDMTGGVWGRAGVVRDP